MPRVNWIMHSKCIHALTKGKEFRLMHFFIVLKKMRKHLKECYSVMAPEKWWRIVDVGAVSPCAWRMTSPLGTPRGRYDECSG
jgi:hypothetical protein